MFMDIASLEEQKQAHVLPNDMKQSDTLSTFKRRIKSWKGEECNCRLCRPFVAQVGFLRCYYGIRLQNFSIFQKSPFLSINYRKVWKWSLLFHCNDAKLNKWPFTYDGMFQLALATT